MIELVKRFPLVCVISGLIVIAIISHFYDNNRQCEQVQLTKFQETSEEEYGSRVEQEENEYVLPEPSLAINETEPESQEMAQLEKSQGEAVLLEDQQPIKVPIYICGAVRYPGVYYVQSTAIIDEVVKQSGGFTDEADVTAVNLASPIIANEKIIIPKQGEEIDKLIESYDNIEGNEETQRPKQESSIERATNRGQTQSCCVNINTADQQELMKLPGIGEVKAAAIIAYRQEHGLFNSKEEIKHVSGIGDKTYEKLAQLITIE